MRKLVFALAILLTGFGVGFSALADAQKDPAGADQMVVVSPSQEVELSLDPIQPPREISRGPALANSVSKAPLDNRVEAVTVVRGTGPKPKPGVLVATLWSTPADGTRLVVQNGYDYPIIYQAFLITLRDGQRHYQPTSICPVKPGLAGVESWPGVVAGIAMVHIQGVDPGQMACNDGSALRLAAELPKDDVIYTCVAGEVLNPKSPVEVLLSADSAGSIREVSARWSLSSGLNTAAPSIILDYPLVGDAALRSPLTLSVFAIVGANPLPAAKGASVHVFLNGVEKASRPWRLYAQQRENVQTLPTGARPVALVGLIPFAPRTPSTPEDGGLRDLLGAVGQDGDRLEVRIIGDDNSILGKATYAADHPPVRSKLIIDPLLANAIAQAKTPTQCHKQPG